MNNIYHESVQAVKDGAKFRVDLERRNLTIDGKKIITNGEYEGELGMSLATLDDFLYTVERLYTFYKHSVPSERSESKSRQYFRALPERELSDEDMLYGKRRDPAQIELELYILCQVLLGMEWNEERMGKWFWQSKEDKDLVILKLWIHPGNNPTNNKYIMSKKNETKVLCPECGAELAIADKTITTVATVIGKDAGIGVVYAEVVGKEVKPAKKLPKTAKERIEALRDAGVDVSHLFAMQGANGGECVASNKDGKLVVLDDNDPLFELIIKQGTVPNPRLFRRWVMAQMFHMMTALDYRTKQPMGVTAMIHRMGYEYQWKMLLDELYAQMKMEHRDPENFTDRNRWFNAEVATKMASEYIGLLKKRVDMIKVRKCKGVPYKRIAGKNIFVSDLYSKLYRPLESAMYAIRRAKSAAKLYEAVAEFNSLRLKMHWQTPQCSAWIDAYKGSGAFFTMQNLIRFHGCVAYDDAGKRLDKYQSLAFITTKAKMYRNGDGWRLLAVLKKMLEDNGIDLKRKMAEWRKK